MLRWDIHASGNDVGYKYLGQKEKYLRRTYTERKRAKGSKVVVQPRKIKVRICLVSIRFRCLRKEISLQTKVSNISKITEQEKTVHAHDKKFVLMETKSNAIYTWVFNWIISKYTSIKTHSTRDIKLKGLSHCMYTCKIIYICLVNFQSKKSVQHHECLAYRLLGAKSSSFC